MLKRSYFVYEMKISCVKMLQFRMLFTCEITYEIFVRVVVPRVPYIRFSTTIIFCSSLIFMEKYTLIC